MNRKIEIDGRRTVSNTATKAARKQPLWCSLNFHAHNHNLCQGTKAGVEARKYQHYTINFCLSFLGLSAIYIYLLCRSYPVG